MATNPPNPGAGPRDMLESKTEPPGSSLTDAGEGVEERIRFATVLVELHELFDAEAVVAQVLEDTPDSLSALELLAKIKHIRGQLSAAVACWAQVHARSPQYESAPMYLTSILELARNPEKGAGDFLALGQFQMWRKPAVYVELEAAFRLFLARKVDEAVERCRRLAGKYRGADQNLYKLSVLARAWISELSGDLDGARTTLEELGRERGFETDIDRVFTLARVYEQVGTKESLEKAAHIFRYLDRSVQGISVQGHLAALCRALSRPEEAQEHERRFQRVFRQRMYRPAPADVTRVAASTYIPLDKLAEITFPPGEEFEPAGEETDRERAIRMVLMKDRDEARRLLAYGAGGLDRKYLADIARLDGFMVESVRLYLESLQEGPIGLRVAGWLLDNLDAVGPAGSRLIRKFFREPGAADETKKLLEATLKAVPLRASLWRQLAALQAVQGNDAEAAQCAERARALEEAARAQKSPVGRVLAAAVYHFVGKAKGLIHEVWAQRKPAEPGRGGFLEEVLGNVTPDMTQAVRNTFLSVREYARAKFPHQTADILDYQYAFKITKEDEPSHGLSGGLPAAVAFMSVFLNRAVPQDVALSGAVVADSHDVVVTAPVGDVEYKLGGAYNRNLSRLILPEANRKDLLVSPRVPSAVREEIVRYVSDLDQAVSLVFGEAIWTEI